MKTFKNLILTLAIITTSVSFAELPNAESSVSEEQVINQFYQMDQENYSDHQLKHFLNDSYKLRIAKVYTKAKVATLTGRGGSIQVNIAEELEKRQKTWNEKYKGKFGGISFNKAMRYFEKYTLAPSTLMLSFEIPTINQDSLHQSDMGRNYSPSTGSSSTQQPSGNAFSL